jgi:translation initiation factor IF-3
MEKNKLISNEKIKDKKVLVIDNTGKNLGVINTIDALKLAKDAELDLIIINQSKDGKSPSVAKIVDTGKYLYELKIKQKSSKPSSQQTKEITVKPQIGHNDLVTYSKKAMDWVKNGNLVQFRIKTYGRVGYMPELIQKVYDDFVQLLIGNAKVVVPFKKLSPVLYTATFGRNK